MKHFVVAGAAGELRGFPAGMLTAVKSFQVMRVWGQQTMYVWPFGKVFLPARFRQSTAASKRTFSTKKEYKSEVNLGIMSMASLLNSIIRVGSINAHCKCPQINIVQGLTHFR